MLPRCFKSILWFTDYRKLSLRRDWKIILFQALEKGRMEHLDYLQKKIGRSRILRFAKENAGRFSRKSILPFLKTIYS